MVHMIYLAAGFSSRFGANKLLYSLEGKPMYRHVLDRLLMIRKEGNIPCDITVVTQYDSILRDLSGLPLRAVVNPDPGRGISSSLQTGIADVIGQGMSAEDYLFFANGDQPFLKKKTVEDFIGAVTQSGRKLACVSYRGEMYSPSMFHASFVPALMDIRGDRGGKGILRKNQDCVLLFEVSDKEELEDIDVL